MSLVLKRYAKSYATRRFSDLAREIHDNGATWEEIAEAARITEENASYLASKEKP